jgi:hypothetical protein
MITESWIQRGLYTGASNCPAIARLQQFMEPEGSLTSSQNSSADSCPEPDDSNPCLPFTSVIDLEIEFSVACLSESFIFSRK